MSANAEQPRTPGTTRIVLHGKLKRDFGGPFDWGCPTPANAIYALITNKPGFRQALEKGHYRVVRGALRGGMDLDENMLHIRFGAVPEFHIIPVAAGAGNGSGGLVKAIIGVVLIAVAVVTAQPELVGLTAGAAGSGASVIAGTAAFGLGNTLFGVTAGALGLFGFGMLVGGVGDILSRQPKPPRPNASFLLSIPGNNAAQGGPVPIAYGYPRVGSTTISTGYQAVALNASNQNDYSNPTSGGSFDNLPTSG